MPIAPVSAVVQYGIARKKPAHECRQTGGTATEQNVSMIGHQRPCIDGRPCIYGYFAHTGYKSLTILIVINNLSSFNPPDNHMMQCPGASSLGPRGISAPLFCPCCLSLFSFYHLSVLILLFLLIPLDTLFVRFVNNVPQPR